MRIGLLAALLSCACTATEVAPRLHEEPPNACHAAPPGRRLVRLTDRQHANAIRDLLGVEIAPVRTPGQSVDPFVAASELIGVSGTLAHQYQVAADLAADQAAARLSAWHPSELIDRFAARAFRRPLDAEEREGLMLLHQDGGARSLVEAVLQHPAFLYRSELSEELSPFELATALSFTFFDSVPDEVLWEKALDGSLADRSVFEAEVDRLLLEPRVRANLTRLIVDWLGARRVLLVHRNPDLYPEFDDALATALLADVERFVAHVLADGGGVEQLLTSRIAFVEEATAPLYGVEETGMVELGPERAGVLTRAGLITAYAQTDAVSVVHQGLFIRRALLCGDELQSPPSDLVRSVDAETQGLDARGLAEFRLQHPACSGCHQEIDPLGVPFLGFDALGRFTEGDRQVAARTAEELAAREDVARCVSSHLAAGVLGTRTDCFEGDSFLELFSTIAKSDAFAHRSAP